MLVPLAPQPLVIIESPYAGDVERNTRYLRAALADSLHRGEAPIASHGLYTQPGVLDDTRPDDRELGMRAGFVWRVRVPDVVTVFYLDLGWSPGMCAALEHVHALSRSWAYRKMGFG